MTYFGCCRVRLESAIAEACALEASWPAGVAAAVQAALRVAAADPEAARTLTEGAGHRRGDDEEFTALMVDLAARLDRGAPPRNDRLPPAPALIARIARQVNLELEAGRGHALAATAPDLTFLLLMPYLGFAEARRWCQPTDNGLGHSGSNARPTVGRVDSSSSSDSVSRSRLSGSGSGTRSRSSVPRT